MAGGAPALQSQLRQPWSCRATCILRNCRQELGRRLVKVPGQLKLANPLTGPEKELPYGRGGGVGRGLGTGVALY
jgi:hypothetical protein